MSAKCHLFWSGLYVLMAKANKYDDTGMSYQQETFFFFSTERQQTMNKIEYWTRKTITAWNAFFPDLSYLKLPKSYLPSHVTFLKPNTYTIYNHHPGDMMTSSNGNIFCVTGPLCEEFTGHQWNPSTKASGAELWCFLWSAPEWIMMLRPEQNGWHFADNMF